ncbi:hypothetical protein [Serratia marcescens]|uniref:hypothetical protein n=1 Tax=Serratia marcescens TaxID=615 RepID=UPI002880CB5E|nr:hypothetical protein [Serratia marcescens]MDT0206248.1 hypothetical protein [Serratia marcescens]
MCNKCKENTNQRKLVLSDDGTSTQLTIDNTNSIDLFHKLIDGCVITVGKRCDHYVKFDNNGQSSHLFVELKGSDVEKAAEQIVSTIKSGAIKFKNGETKHAAIISTRNPLNSTETAKMKKKFLIKEGMKLHFFKMKATEKASSFV